MKVKDIYWKQQVGEKIRPLTGILFFLLLLFSFHFIYLFWQAIGYWPLGSPVNGFFISSGRVLLEQSIVLLQWIGLPFTIDGETIYITTKSGVTSWVTVSPECAALKQMMHWVFLMIIYPGPRKHKLWFIPSGLVIIHLVSVLRIAGIATGLYFYPYSFDILHDYVFKILFYAIIFFMWVIWEEHIRM